MERHDTSDIMRENPTPRIGSRQCGRPDSPAQDAITPSVKREAQLAICPTTIAAAREERRFFSQQLPLPAQLWNDSGNNLLLHLQQKVLPALPAEARRISFLPET